MVFEAIVALPKVGELQCNPARGVFGGIELVIAIGFQLTARWRSRLKGYGCFISKLDWYCIGEVDSVGFTFRSVLSIASPTARLVQRDSRETSPYNAECLWP